MDKNLVVHKGDESKGRQWGGHSQDQKQMIKERALRGAVRDVKRKLRSMAEKETVCMIRNRCKEYICICCLHIKNTGMTHKMKNV